jgi:hypothetical protein
VDGLLHRHGHQELLLEAAAALVAASKMGPAALQVGSPFNVAMRLMAIIGGVWNCQACAASQLAAAAAAVHVLLPSG